MSKNIVWERIESLIKRENISAYKLGKDTGISTASLTDWKKGRSSPKLDKLKTIADYFGVSVYYLTGEVEGFDPARQQKIDFIHQCGADIDLSMYDDDSVDDLYVAYALKKDVIHNLPLPEIKKAPPTLISVESADGVNLKAVLEYDNILSYGKHIITNEERTIIKALIEAFLNSQQKEI